MTDRAVSDLVGFVLIFSLIISGATLALTVGESELEDIRTFEQQENAERSFVLLGQNFAELEYSRAVTVSGSIDLNDGQVRYENESSVTVIVNNGAGEQLNETIRMGSIVYEIDDTTVRYESGLVTRADSGNGVRVTSPRFTCESDSDDTDAFLSVVSLNGAEGHQITSGVIQIVARQHETRLSYPRNRTGAGSATDATDVSLQVNSTREDVWDRYLEENNWSPTGDDGEYECDVADGSAHVRHTAANVSFER